jgi:hypothetical protein
MVFLWFTDNISKEDISNEKMPEEDISKIDILKEYISKEDISNAEVCRTPKLCSKFQI